MKTSKILLSGVAAIAAGFAFAIPGITPPTPEEPECPYTVPAIVPEKLPLDINGLVHGDAPQTKTYIRVITPETSESESQTLYLTAAGKGVEDITKAEVFTLYSNKTIDAFQIANKAGKYLQYKEIEVLDNHKHVKNAVTGKYCCDATKEITESHKEYVMTFGDKPATEKTITFTGSASTYSLAWNGKQVSSTVYAGSEWTAPGADKDVFTFNTAEEKCVEFVTQAQVEYIALAAKAIEEHWQDPYQKGENSANFDNLMKLAENKDLRTDFPELIEDLKKAIAAEENAVANLEARDQALDYIATLNYQGTDYKELQDLVDTFDKDADSEEFIKKLDEAKAAQEHAEATFNVEMIDSTYNKQVFAVTILQKDIKDALDNEILSVSLGGIDAKNFVLSEGKVISIVEDDDACKVSTIVYTVRRADKTFGEGIYTAKFDVAVGSTAPVYASLPVKGYDQQIRWTVGSTLFNTDYDLLDGLLFFRQGTKSLYFSTVGYDPRLTGCKPKAVLTMDAGLKDFTITQPELVETVGEFTYWKVDVTYQPTGKIDYAAVNLDNTFVTVYLPYLELKEIEWPKTAGMPVKGCTFDVIASEPTVNFPWYGSNGPKEPKKIDLSYEKFSGYLLYDQVFVASNTPAYQVVFTDVLPMDAPAYNYFKGAGTQNITITANPLFDLGVEEGIISVYGVRHGKTLDKIVDIPVTTTHPSVDYTANWESKNFDLTTKTLTLGGDVKENYMDEVEIVVEDLVNYYSAIKDLKVQTNNDQFVVSQTSRFVPGEGKYYATINVKYVPCEAHETIEGKLYVQVAGVEDALLEITLKGVAGDEATVAAVKGSSAGINAVAADKANAVRYNVAGQRVNNAKGIVIENGKKYVK